MDADGSPDDVDSDDKDSEIDAMREIFDLERLDFDDEKGLDNAWRSEFRLLSLSCSKFNGDKDRNRNE